MTEHPPTQKQAVPAAPPVRPRAREVLQPADFTAADVETIRQAGPLPEAAAFDHEVNR